MKKLVYFSLTILLSAVFILGAPNGGTQKTFVGNISDSMCGLKHMMAGGDKDCTLKCVSSGAKFVLADPTHKKVYQLSDLEKPKESAGQKVKVTGTLTGDTIKVTSIVAAQ